MSTSARTSVGKRWSLFATVGAVIGLVLAVGWFFAVRQLTRGEQQARQAQSLSRAGELIELLRQSTQERAKGAAQLLAEDPRLKSTLSAANVDDATILDILQDLQKLSGQPVFAVLTPAGRVRVVIGAPKLKGLDLSTSSVVKGALGQEGASLGVWLVEDRVAEIAVSAVRIGERTVALLVVGNLVPDVAFAKAAQSAGVHLALMADERLVWSDTAVAPSTWAGEVQRIEVKSSVPPARFMATPVPADDATARLAFAVPLVALLFAVLAFWRGGAR
jgi:hypothetical protein